MRRSLAARFALLLEQRQQQPGSSISSSSAPALVREAIAVLDKIGATTTTTRRSAGRLGETNRRTAAGETPFFIRCDFFNDDTAQYSSSLRRRRGGGRGGEKSAFERDDFYHRRGFAASSVRRYSAETSSSSSRDSDGRARKESTLVASAGQAQQTLSSSSSSSMVASESAEAAKPKVDVNALKRARIEIEMMRREQHINFAKRTYQSVANVTKYVISWGPYSVQLLRQSPSEWKVTLNSAWKHAKHEFAHYWSGAKLLWVEVKIASRLGFKLMGGQTLTRRERRQLTRTTADVFRLVPFAVFVLVPFMEIFLPVALKIFPNMLPSTFRDELKHEEELKRKLKAKIEVAKFLQDTVKVMAKGLKYSSSGVKREKADALYEFMNAVRSGKTVTNEQIVRFAKLFNDDFTLDNINRTQLVNMCKFVGISPYGTDTFLRYQLRNKLREIKQDDRLIQLEGVEGLSDEELKSAARTRGMRWEEDRKELERQLKDWLELSLSNNLPSSLLILSRAFIITHAKEEDTQTATLKDITDTLASLPEEVVTQVSVETAMAHESSSEEYKKKLEYLMREEETIKQEAKDTEAREKRLKAEAYMKEKMRLYLSGPQFPERFWANVRGRDAMLEWEAEEAKREEMEIAKAAMEKYLKGMQYSERFWANARKSTTSHLLQQQLLAQQQQQQQQSEKEVEASTADVAKMEMVSEDATKPSESLSPKRVVDEASDVLKAEEESATSAIPKMEKTLVSGAPDAERVILRTSLSSAELEEQDKHAADAMQKTKRSEVDSCSDEETDFEMQTRKSKRRAQLSRLLAMVLDTSGVSDERRMLTELVEQKLDAYTERKDELVELRALRTGGNGGSSDPFYDEDPFAPSPIELKKMREEEQDANRLAASSSGGIERTDESLLEKEQDEEDEYTHSKEEASLTNKIADDVSARVDEMLRKVESELSAAEAAIGEKFKLLDADNDGIISLEELLNVTNVCKTTEVGEDAESELRELLKDLSDEEGFVRVEDLKRLSLEMLRLEAAEEEEEEEEEDSRKSMAVKKSSS